MITHLQIKVSEAESILLKPHSAEPARGKSTGGYGVLGFRISKGSAMLSQVTLSTRNRVPSVTRPGDG